MKARAGFMAGVLALVGLLVPAVATAQTRTISVSGSAAIYVVPDEVIVNLGVDIQDKDLAAARAEVDKTTQALLRAIRDLGIEERHIQTDVLRIHLVERVPDQRQPVSADAEIERIYNFVQNFSVTVKDVSKFDAVISAALDSGANRMDGFEFRTTELRKHRDEARVMAIRAAREKAVAFAAEVGCDVGPPRTINEGSGLSLHGQNMRVNNSVSIPESSFGDGEALPLGQIGVTANVSVVFDLIPRLEKAAGGSANAE